MLEERSSFTCVGFIQLSDGTPNYLYTNGESTTIYRDDESNGIVYEMDAPAGVGDYADIDDDDIADFISKYYSKGVRGAIFCTNKQVVAFYMDSNENYFAGVQDLSLYETQNPVLTEVCMDYESDI